ncbi:phage tail protein [Fructobacillus sp. M158]|uniref:phage tail protein n=1 Tax=Fructobacillus parabroussonetiae TaxID=2713174 RepID=UPI00200AEF2E|nr:phage tail protein [Fructobacillus parabroussonetiae]MCK8617556.1 phage tail protein [Fructobacillus parabroussonetiae]
MATLGIKRAWVARIGDDGKVITGINGINGDPSDKDGKFLIDESTSHGVASANMTNLQGALSDIWASNKLVYKSAAKGNAQTVLTVMSLPAEVKGRILGLAEDGRGGFSINGKANSNNRIALLVESADAFDETKSVYIGFFQGIVTEAFENVATNDSAEKRTTDVLTFGHLERRDEGFGKRYFSWLDNFDKDKMFAEIFPSGTTVSSSSASATSK